MQTLCRLKRPRKNGGGVCAYIRKEIKATVPNDLSSTSERYFHQLWLKLQYEKLKSVLVCVSYRPPNCPVSCLEDYFKHKYIQALAQSKPVIVLGDLNCNILRKSPESEALNEIIKDVNLTQVIKTSPQSITYRCYLSILTSTFTR